MADALQSGRSRAVRLAGAALVILGFAPTSARAGGGVLDVVADFGAIGDGVTDDHAAIQAALDAASAGDTVYFPPASVGYRIASGLTLVVPSRDLTLLGEGWTSGGAPTRSNGGVTGVFSGSRLLRTEPVPRGALLQVNGNVVVDGLHLDGGLYGRYGADPDAEGILCWGAGFGDLSNVTIRNCLIENFTTRALAVNGTDDGWVENCLFQRCDLGGAYLSRVRRWQVRACGAVDIGDSPQPGQPYGNHYPFVVTADAGGLSCEDVILADCLVEHAPNWVGILDHGTTRWLAFGCRVVDAGSGINDASYINHTLGKDEHHVIDCEVERILGSWGIDLNSVERRGSLIGNRVLDLGTTPSWIYVLDCPVKPITTWNEVDGGYALAGSLDPAHAGRPITAWTSGHNRLGGRPIALPDWVNLDGAPVNQVRSVTPPAPRGLKAIRTIEGVVLRWRQARADDHDSFLLEWSQDGKGGWTRVAFLPPNNGLWDFDAPTNPHWRPFDPLRHLHRGATGGVWRIRAQMGEAFSAWCSGRL